LDIKEINKFLWSHPFKLVHNLKRTTKRSQDFKFIGSTLLLLVLDLALVIICSIYLGPSVRYCVVISEVVNPTLLSKNRWQMKGSFR